MHNEAPTLFFVTRGDGILLARYHSTIGQAQMSGAGGSASPAEHVTTPYTGGAQRPDQKISGGVEPPHPLGVLQLNCMLHTPDQHSVPAAPIKESIIKVVSWTWKKPYQLQEAPPAQTTAPTKKSNHGSVVRRKTSQRQNPSLAGTVHAMRPSGSCCWRTWSLLCQPCCSRRTNQVHKQYMHQTWRVATHNTTNHHCCLTLLPHNQKHAHTSHCAAEWLCITAYDSAAASILRQAA